MRILSPDGSELVLPTPPARILPAFASAVDFLVDLVPAERVVALPPTAHVWSVLADEQRSVGGWTQLRELPEFKAEAVLATSPDLVLVQPWLSAATITTLRDEGLQVLSLPVAASWEDILASLRLLATIVGAEPRGAELIAGLEGRRSAMHERAARGKPLRVLCYSSFGSGATTAGARSTGDQVIELAGLVNAARGAGLSGNPPIDHERVLELAPDVFLVPIPNEETPGSSRAILLAEPLLALLPAIREERFVEIPMHLFTAASHRLLDAAELLAERVEPWR
jgi:iron complex transport system substrate-binding protein